MFRFAVTHTVPLVVPTCVFAVYEEGVAKMKKTTAVLLAAAMLLGYSAAAKDEIKVYYDGAEIEFDTTPEIVNERTFVPLRAIAETLGAEVAWDGSKEMITLSKDGVETYLVIGSDETKTTKDGKSSSGKLDAAPYIKDERTMVPVRFISETFGMDVDWNGETLSVLIDQPEPIDAQTPLPTEELPDEQLTDDEKYEKMYEGTRYRFVQNVPELTNDFESGAGSIEMKKHSALGTDVTGNGVMYVQKDRRNGETDGYITATLQHMNQYGDKIIYDISFDLYCPPVNGSVAVRLLGMKETDIGSVMISDFAGKCIVGNKKDEEFVAAEYFNNNTNGNDEDVVLANSAHINMLVDMKRRRYTVTVTGVENDAEPRTVSAELINYGSGTGRIAEFYGYKTER